MLERQNIPSEQLQTNLNLDCTKWDFLPLQLSE